MSCVSSSSFVVLVNGEDTNFFRSDHGLRQGFPLSPLLFILVLEGLSLLLKERKATRKSSSIRVSRMIKILHIVFVDDILIMKNTSINEWIEIDGIIKFFCKASGLKVNEQKAIVPHVGLSKADLALYMTILPYNFTMLTTCFRYLGLYLTIGLQKSVDWNWLLSKMEKKIDLWCNRWLSLGGHFILVKSTLESLHVYWMSLATIQCTILNKIRIIMFNFLWSGNMDSSHFHLCRWDTLAKPKSYGGSGFRNIFHFSKSLVANTLWRVLMGVGI
jgi:hypothetical protein